MANKFFQPTSIFFLLFFAGLLVAPVHTLAASNFSVHSDNISPSNWLGLDEDQVFYRRLEHSQPGNDWTIKVGKGGQLYSIKTPQTGEMISFQRSDHGQWVDEVFQHVIPSTIQKNATTCDTVDGDIHQAGYYTISDLDCSATGTHLIPASIYSPLFNFKHQEQDSSVSFTTWPQHAHLPRTYSDNGMLMHQTIKDQGDGVIELTLKIEKWSGAATTALVLPHSPWRQDALPTTILSRPNGSYQPVTVTPQTQAQEIRLNDHTTNGWMAFTTGTTPTSRGIGIVYGGQLSSIERNTSFINLRAPESFNNSIDKTTTVASFIRHVDLVAGDSFSIRYYLVIGSLAKIQQYGNQLQSQVLLQKTSPLLDQTDPSQISICSDTTYGLNRGCLTGQTPLFYTLRDFTTHAKPLFLLKETATSNARLTNNPYEISTDPTDGKTKYVNFLGWALPSSAVPANSQLYKLLGNLVNQSLFAPNSASKQTLMVMTYPSSSIPADLNNDGRVNLADYNRLLSGYGTTYNLSHFNQLLANYGH